MEIKKSEKICKCTWCGNKDSKGVDMEVELVGAKQSKKYYHVECHKLFLENKEFKKQEQIELDSLYETIKKIHGVELISNYCFILLSDVRNGNYGINRQNRNYYTYKKGYKYSTIEESYRMSEDSIKWSKSNKNFKDFNNEFSYCMTIVVGNLQQAQNRIEQREKNRISAQAHIDKLNESVDVEDVDIYESSYKKPKKNKNDISDFLD